MYGSPEIIDTNPIVGIEQKHTRQRTDSNLVDIDTRIESHFHIIDGRLARPDRKPIGCRSALTIQQRMDHDRVSILRRLLDPECAKGWKLLTFRVAGLEG